MCLGSGGQITTSSSIATDWAGSPGVGKKFLGPEIAAGKVLAMHPVKLDSIPNTASSSSSTTRSDPGASEH